MFGQSLSKSKYFLRFLTLLLLGFSLSCTRERSESNTSSFRLNFPSQLSKDLESFAGINVLVHVVINVSGTGITPVRVLTWSARSAGNEETLLEPPSGGFQMDVPSGAERLIQVLLVYENDESGQMAFKYKSLKADLAPGTKELSLPITEFANVGSATAGQGQIVGRFVDSNGRGPTGRVQMKFTPPDGLDMLIETSEMFGGWFDVFGVEGANFRYVMDNGFVLFGGPVSVDNNALLATGIESHRNLRALMPAFYEEREPEGGGTPYRNLQGRRQIVAGFWGPGSSTKKICYTTNFGGVSIPGAFTSGNISISSTVLWNPAVSLPTNSTTAYVEFANGGARGGVATLAAGEEGACSISGGVPFVDYVSFRHDNMAQHGGMLGFRGPFRLKKSDYGYPMALEVDSSSGSELVVNWGMLPGVQSSLDGTYRAIDGLDIFVRNRLDYPGLEDDFRDHSSDEGVRCGDLQGLGFTQVRTQLSNPTKLEYSITITSAALATLHADGDLQTVLCPWSYRPSKEYWKSGAYDYGYGGMGSGGGPAVAVGFKGQNLMRESNCKDMDLALLDSNGNYADSASNVSGFAVSLSYSGPSMVFFKDSCGGSYVSEVTIPAGQNAIKVGISKSVGAGIFSISAGASGLAATDSMLYVAPNGEMTNIQFYKSNGEPLMALGTGICQEMILKFDDMTNLSTNISLSGENIQFYSSLSGCGSNTGAITMLTTPPSVSISSSFAVKAPNPGMVNMEALIPAYAGGAVTYPIYSMHGVGAGSAGAALYFGATFASNPISSFSCVEVSATGKNYLGSDVAVNHNISGIRASADGGNLTIYGSSSDCVNGIGGSQEDYVSFSLGQVDSTSLWVKTSEISGYVGLRFFKDGGGGGSGFVPYWGAGMVSVVAPVPAISVTHIGRHSLGSITVVYNATGDLNATSRFQAVISNNDSSTLAQDFFTSAMCNGMTTNNTELKIDLSGCASLNSGGPYYLKVAALDGSLNPLPNSIVVADVFVLQSASVSGMAWNLPFGSGAIDLHNETYSNALLGSGSTCSVRAWSGDDSTTGLVGCTFTPLGSGSGYSLTVLIDQFLNGINYQEVVQFYQ